MLHKAQLKLCSPIGGEPVVYAWPLCMTKQYNGAAEIIETIRWISEDYPEVRIVIERFAVNVDTTDYMSMKNLCDKFNCTVKTIKQLWQGVTKAKERERASTALLRHIVQQVYNHSVSEPDKLNQYEPFSPEVYGETSYDLVAKMIEKVNLTEDDMFIDLGSGVGQVVLQIAGSSPCYKCVGIEKGEWPNRFAVILEKEFRRWMKWYGKKYQSFELINGDFLDEKYRDLIMQATVIFVNNFAFGPEVDHKLKLIFAEMKDGTKIVSSKAFCSLNFRISDRNLSDIGSIMKVEELASMPESVSWTGRPVTYYLHTIDRSKLEDYFACIKNNPHDLYHRTSLSKSSSNSKCSSRDSSSSTSRDTSSAKYLSSSVKNEENVVIGTTTRRQWSNWVAQQEKMKAKNINEKIRESESALSNDTGSEKDAPTAAGEMKFIITGKTQKRSKSKKKFGIKPVPKAGSSQVKKMPLTSKKGKHGNERWMRTYHWVNQKHDEGFGNAEATDSIPEDVNHPKNKQLDVFIDQVRRQFENFLIYMQNDDYRRRLVEEIEVERIRNRDLLYLCEQRERQIKKLQEDGLELLQARLKEVDIVAPTPTELLNQAKEIVIYHKALQSKANLLQEEIQKLEHNNEIMIEFLKQRDDQIMRSGSLRAMGFPDNLSREEIKMNLTFEIDALFSKRKALISQQRKLEEEIRRLEEELPENGSSSYTELAKPLANSGLAQESSTIKCDYATLPVVKKPRRKAARAVRDAAVAGGQGEQKRNEPLGGGTPTRCQIQSQSEQDIEEKIKDIVRKALSVDSAAKNAEKERKARNAEKRRDEKFKRKGGGGAAAPSSSKSLCSEFQAAAGASAKSGVASNGETVRRNVVAAGGWGDGGQPDPSTSVCQQSRPFVTEGKAAGGGMVLTNADSVLQFNSGQFGKGSGTPPVATATIADRRGIAFPAPQQVSVSDRPTLPRPNSEPTLSSTNSTPLASGTTAQISEYPRVSSAYEQRARPFAVQNLIRFPASADQRSSLLALEVASATAGSPEERRVHASICMDYMSHESTICVPHASLAPPPSCTSGWTVVGSDDTASVDSGYAGTVTESASSSGRGQGYVDSVTPDLIGYRNKFKNSSNTGNPGNPHDYSNPGNPVVDDTSADVTDPKPLQPFRIPRKISHNDATTVNRSPLATMVTPKKDDSSSWKNASLPVRGKRKTSGGGGGGGGSPVRSKHAGDSDHGWQSQGRGGNALPRRSPKCRSITSESSSTDSRNRACSAHVSEQCTSLTKETLERHSLQASSHSIAGKGLMEALLEHKMNTGRIEPSCKIIDTLATRCEGTSRGPQTPPGSPPEKMHGPKTPQSTPPMSDLGYDENSESQTSDVGITGGGAVSSAEEEKDEVDESRRRHCRRRHSSHSKSSEMQRDCRSSQKTLEAVAAMTNMDANYLKRYLSVETFKTLQGIDPALLVATLSTLLTSVVQSLKQKKEVVTVAPAAVNSKVEDKKTAADEQQPLKNNTDANTPKKNSIMTLTSENHTSPVADEMEIESSNSSKHSMSPCRESNVSIGGTTSAEPATMKASRPQQGTTPCSVDLSRDVALTGGFAAQAVPAPPFVVPSQLNIVPPAMLPMYPMNPSMMPMFDATKPPPPPPPPPPAMFAPSAAVVDRMHPYPPLQQQSRSGALSGQSLYSTPGPGRQPLFSFSAGIGLSQTPGGSRPALMPSAPLSSTIPRLPSLMSVHATPSSSDGAAGNEQTPVSAEQLHALANLFSRLAEQSQTPGGSRVPTTVTGRTPVVDGPSTTIATSAIRSSEPHSDGGDSTKATIGASAGGGSDGRFSQEDQFIPSHQVMTRPLRVYESCESIIKQAATSTSGAAASVDPVSDCATVAKSSSPQSISERERRYSGDVATSSAANGPRPISLFECDPFKLVGITTATGRFTRINGGRRSATTHRINGRYGYDYGHGYDGGYSIGSGKRNARRPPRGKSYRRYQPD